MESVKGLYGDAAGFPGAVRGSRVWWVAPDYPRAIIGWNLVKKFSDAIPPGLKRTSEEQRKIEFPHSDGFMQIKSGFDPDSLRGEGLDHVTMDEAAFMDERAWIEGIRPALAERRGSADFISTPNGFNFFYDLYDRGEREEAGEWKSFHGTSYDNPYVPNEELDAAWEDYKEAGQEHVFRQEFMAQFLEGAGQPIFRREWFSNGRNRYDPNDEAMLRMVVGRWMAADTANKDKVENARSVFLVADLTPRYELLIRDCIFGRWEYNELLSNSMSFARKWRGVYQSHLRRFWIEDAASGTALIQNLRHSAPKWLATRVVPAKPIPKEVAWQDASAWCARDFVKLPYPDESNRHWLLPMETEIFNVPGSKFYDFADTFSILIRHVAPLFAAAYRGRAA